jgi:hypothetical protein
MVATKIGDLWALHDTSQPHNHLPSSDPSSHARHRRNDRNKPEIFQLIFQKLLSNSPPKNIYSEIKGLYPNLAISVRDIYNLRSDFRRILHHGLPAIQALITNIGEDFEFDYTIDTRNRLENLLFFHRKSLLLLERFPFSLLFDTTYKTNRFGLYLLDIVGVTAMGDSFVVGQAFLSHEE